MGTRSGSIDASLVLYLMEKKGFTPKEMSDYLNKKSGYLGISGFTNDDRDIRKAAAEGNKRAQLAGDILRYGIKKYIGAYTAAMGGLDAVVFTGRYRREFRSRPGRRLRPYGISGNQAGPSEKSGA